jgi:MFS family permease
VTRRTGDPETSEDEKGAASPRLRAAALSRSTIIIGLVSLMADISSEMIYPLLPIFLTQTLAAPATIVGLIEGIAVGTASIVSGISGRISDLMGRRKPVAFFGYLLTALSRPLIAFAAGWPVVLGARFADRFGKGIRTAPRDALLSESSTVGNRGYAFGFERAMDSAGAVIGPLFGLFLYAWVGLNVRNVFLLSCIPAAIASLLILTVRERRGAIVPGAKSLKLSLAGTTREYRRLLIVVGVFGLANSANAFLILRAQGLGLSTQSTIIAYALYNAVAALSSIPAGKASDRLGRRDLLIIGYSIYAVVYFGFAATNDAWLVWPLFAFYGLFPALTDGVAKALATDTAGSAGRATAIGVYSAVIGGTQILASYIGGLLWDQIDPRATFYFGTALAAVSVILLFVLLPSRVNKESQ